jgi:hypothetical protein
MASPEKGFSTIKIQPPNMLIHTSVGLEAKEVCFSHSSKFGVGIEAGGGNVTVED